MTYAVLTDAGLEKLRAAADVHLAGVSRLFAERFSDDELETLAALLGRLDGAGDGEDCAPGS